MHGRECVVLTKAYCVFEGWVELIAPPPTLLPPSRQNTGFGCGSQTEDLSFQGGRGPPFLPDGKGLEEANLEGSSLGGGGGVLKVFSTQIYQC